jgi:hypothetical protein
MKSRRRCGREPSLLPVALAIFVSSGNTETPVGGRSLRKSRWWLDAGELFSHKEGVDRAVDAKNFMELVAALNAPAQ